MWTALIFQPEHSSTDAIEKEMEIDNRRKVTVSFKKKLKKLARLEWSFVVLFCRRMQVNNVFMGLTLNNFNLFHVILDLWRLQSANE